MSEGETPSSMVLFVYDRLVGEVRLGERVELTGIFQAIARRVNPKIMRVKSVYRTYVDVILPPSENSPALPSNLPPPPPHSSTTLLIIMSILLING